MTLVFFEDRVGVDTIKRLFETLFGAVLVLMIAFTGW
jgi:hypothetical protein